jgi:hypothetical protein|tara:strand:+ start:3241 stop:3465 length:225 start_codon:yes stop_codon:yes gene_type:complete
MNNEQVLAIVDAIKDIGYTLSHTLGDSETGSNDGNVGNIMFSMDRMSDNIAEINERLKVLDDSVVAVAQTIHDK